MKAGAGCISRRGRDPQKPTCGFGGLCHSREGQVGWVRTGLLGKVVGPSIEKLLFQQAPSGPRGGEGVRWRPGAGGGCGAAGSRERLALELEPLHLIPEAVHLPTEVSVSHCKGHQKGSREVAQGNQAADQAAAAACS